jgi:hypothetical protein
VSCRSANACELGSRSRRAHTHARRLCSRAGGGAGPLSKEASWGRVRACHSPLSRWAYTPRNPLLGSEVFILIVVPRAKGGAGAAAAAAAGRRALEPAAGLLARLEGRLGACGRGRGDVTAGARPSTGAGTACGAEVRAARAARAAERSGGAWAATGARCTPRAGAAVPFSCLETSISSPRGTVRRARGDWAGGARSRRGAVRGAAWGSHRAGAAVGEEAGFGTFAAERDGRCSGALEAARGAGRGSRAVERNAKPDGAPRAVREVRESELQAPSPLERRRPARRRGALHSQMEQPPGILLRGPLHVLPRLAPQGAPPPPPRSPDATR